jgi:hypothetical protein
MRLAHVSTLGADERRSRRARGRPEDMVNRAKRGLVLRGAGILVVLLLAAGPASAVEYRLFVANIFDRALTSYLTADELYDGGFGSGLNKMVRDLDTGEMESGAIVPQRALEGMPAPVARAWGGVAVRPEVPRGVDTGTWDEIRWQGTPGERSIWIVRSTGSQRPQQIIRVMLKGEGPMRLFQPFQSSTGHRAVVLQIPIGLIAIHESHGTVWDRLVSKGLDLRHGIGGVVALSSTALRADAVYLVVDQGTQPSTFKAVISWEDWNADRELPDHGVLQIQNK